MFWKRSKNILLTSILLIASACYASDVKKVENVNVLVWYGYLDNPEITKIVNEKCHVKMSHDIYYSNDEFLNRYSDNYDAIIFSDTIYNLIRDKILAKKNTIDLSSTIQNFNKKIRKHYYTEDFPKNVSYFMHSLTGFWYNPAIMNIKGDSSTLEIFKQANNNIVIMLDDPVEIWFLINTALGKKSTEIHDINQSIPLTYNNFEKVIKNTKVYISNNNNQIYQNPGFAFAYTWSGDVISYTEDEADKFEFYVNPGSSYVSTDLIASLSNRKATSCVVKTLLSKEVLNKVEKDTQYFSPYLDYNSVDNKRYQQLYDKALKDIELLPWLPKVNSEQYELLSKQWVDIQVDLKKNN